MLFILAFSSSNPLSMYLFSFTLTGDEQQQNLRLDWKDGINPDAFIERGEVLDFLEKFGFNTNDLSMSQRKYAVYSSLYTLIEEALKHEDRKEEMLKRAMYKAEKYLKTAEVSIDNDLKERREKITELETRVASLEERKSLLENDAAFLEEWVEELKLERGEDIVKLQLFASLIDRKGFDPLAILVDYFVSTLNNMKIPPPLINSVKEEYPT